MALALPEGSKRKKRAEALQGLVGDILTSGQKHFKGQSFWLFLKLIQFYNRIMSCFHYSSVIFLPCF